jgi:hypothetical protein
MKGRWRMKKEQAIRKNLDLLNEFMKYAFENPKVLEEIPPEAELIILPIDDPELYEYNKKIANKVLSQGKKVIFVKMKKPEIQIPELMPASP